MGRWRALLRGRPLVGLAVSNEIIALLAVAGVSVAGSMIGWFAIFSTMMVVTIVSASD